MWAGNSNSSHWICWKPLEMAKFMIINIGSLGKMRRLISVFSLPDNAASFSVHVGLPSMYQVMCPLPVFSKSGSHSTPNRIGLLDESKKGQ